MFYPIGHYKMESLQKLDEKEGLWKNRSAVKKKNEMKEEKEMGLLQLLPFSAKKQEKKLNGIELWRVLVMVFLEALSGVCCFRFRRKGEEGGGGSECRKWGRFVGLSCFIGLEV